MEEWKMEGGCMWTLQRQKINLNLYVGQTGRRGFLLNAASNSRIMLCTLANRKGGAAQKADSWRRNLIRTVMTMWLWSNNGSCWGFRMQTSSFSKTPFRAQLVTATGITKIKNPNNEYHSGYVDSHKKFLT